MVNSCPRATVAIYILLDLLEFVSP